MSNEISRFYQGIPDWLTLHHDDEPIEHLARLAQGSPMNIFYSQPIGRRRHEWKVEIETGDGRRENVASGIASSRTAQSRLDDAMSTLAISLVALRDRVVSREASRGTKLIRAQGEAMFGGFWDADVMGNAVLALFEGWAFPLARFPIKRTYEECLVMLWALTNDSIGLAEAAAVAQERRIWEIVRMARQQ